MSSTHHTHSSRRWSTLLAAGVVATLVATTAPAFSASTAHAVPANGPRIVLPYTADGGPITDATIAFDAAGYAFSGLALEPVPTVSLYGRVLTEGVDFSVTYQNNVNIGTATAVITGNGIYSGNTEVSFEIVANPAISEALTLLHALPQNFESLADADKVVEVYWAFGELTPADYTQISSADLELLQDVEGAARYLNQSDVQDGVGAFSDELEDNWYVRLTVVPRTATGSPEIFTQFSNQVAPRQLVKLFDLSFVDTRYTPHRPWTPTEPVHMEFIDIGVTAADGPEIVHQKHDGSLEVIPSTQDEVGVLFTATDFSLYALTTNAVAPAPAPAPAPTPAPAAHVTPAAELAKTGAPAQSGLWIVGAAALAAAAGAGLWRSATKRRQHGA